MAVQDSPSLSPPLDRAAPSATVTVLIGAAVGLIIALVGLDPQFIAGAGGKWIRPENDFASYVVAWRYYAADAWRFPLFSIPAMGYPEGGSVLFADALPLGALLSKLLYAASGLLINPFGWWIFLAHVAQGAMAARLVRAAGAPSTIAAVAAAVVAVCSYSFLRRMGHIGLSSHFLLLWALALYFEMDRARRVKAGEATVCLAITLLVNPYLFVMVGAIVAVTFAAAAREDLLTRRDIGLFAGGALAIVALAVLSGYGVMFSNPTSMQAFGFGFFSWNLPTLLVPPSAIFGLTRDATGGQYEGEAYVGVGVLLMLGAVCLLSPRQALQAAGRHWPLTVLLVLLAGYAASNQIYGGSRLLASYSVPQTFIELGSYFRATGRFVWPLAYVLAIAPIACIFKWWRPRPAAVLVICATLLQTVEMMPAVVRRRASTTRPYPDMLAGTSFPSWIAAHDRLLMYPAWACGGLGPDTRQWGGPETNREMQIEVLAAEMNKPNNSVYTSRLLKDCQADAEWGAHPTLVPGVLHVLNPDTVRSSAPLTALARTASCKELSWAVVCSAQWTGH